MASSLLLFASLLLIIIPILSAQLPRLTNAQTKPQNDTKPFTSTPGESPNQTSQSRKPWKPPFPTSSLPPQKSDTDWLVLPRLSIKDIMAIDGAGEAQNESASGSAESRFGTSGSGMSSPAREAHVEDAPTLRGGSENWMDMRNLLLGVVGGVSLILGFVVFVVHLLAWFIVYKTEARLAEARAGLTTGGEMRLCLCGR